MPAPNGPVSTLLSRVGLTTQSTHNLALGGLALYQRRDAAKARTALQTLSPFVDLSVGSKFRASWPEAPSTLFSFLYCESLLAGLRPNELRIGDGPQLEVRGFVHLRGIFRERGCGMHLLF